MLADSNRKSKRKTNGNDFFLKTKEIDLHINKNIVEFVCVLK